MISVPTAFRLLFVTAKPGRVGQHKLAENIDAESRNHASFPPTVTIKAKIEVVKEIREALTPTQVEIFDRWPQAKKLSFLVDFPSFEAKVSVKLSDVIDIFDKMRKRSLVLEDNDAVKGDERDFGVVSDGDIAAYMSPGPSYTSPASTAQKSLPLAHRRKLRVRRTPLKLKSPMRCYSRKMRCTIPPPASTTMAHVSTISVPMTTTKDFICEPSFWDVLYPGGEKAEYLEEGKLDGLWAFHIDSGLKIVDGIGCRCASSKQHRWETNRDIS
ncbi:hypothetical protein Tco_0185662 [Tanacetum coccineum]